MYIPVKAPKLPKKVGVTTVMASKGMNLRDLPQLLNPDYALDIVNYLITTDGGLQKRKGSSRLFDLGVTTGISMLEKYTDDIYIYAYGDKVSAYDKTTSTSTVIHTYGSASTYNGVRYGDYFFITNKKESIGRISRTLAYDTQTANFTVGKKLTGATSGATAMILEDADSGASGILTLGEVVGTFTVGETITDSAGGTAKVFSAIAWAYTTVSASPICSVINIIGNRLYLGNLQSDSAAVFYSAVDTGTNPPFTNWTIGTLATDPGQVTNRNGEAVTDIVALGPYVLVFQANGKYAFYQDTIDSSGVLTKIDKFVMWRQDMGGARGAIVTPKGCFYVNKAGLWQVVSIGQPNIPYSDQEGLQSVLLGTQYFQDKDLENADIAYYATYNTVLITCAKNSAANNFILAYNTEFKSFSTFTGWNINRFLNDNETIYGASSVAGRVYTLFTGYSDDGVDIWTTYYQELKTGDLPTRQMLYGGWIDGFLSASTSLNVAFDIFDVNGNLIQNKISYTWVPQSSAGSEEGYGDSSWGDSAWGGDQDSAGMQEQFNGFRQFIRNYQRIRVKITGHDKSPHTLVWLRLDSRPKVDIRIRKLTLNN